MKAITLEAVKEKRENYTLKTKSTACLGNLTHTINFKNINRIYKNKKANIIKPSVFYDTG